MCTKKLPQVLGCVVLVELLLVLGANGMPLFDAGPHVSNGWGESIRMRRLSTGRKHGHESYLRIHDDGKVDGEKHLSPHSVLELRGVAAGLVVIKGHQSSLYLCMDSDSFLYGTTIYSEDDCTFKEEILPEGYNTYTSTKYGLVISLSKDKHRHHSKGKASLSHFLPRVALAPTELNLNIGEDERFPNNRDNKYIHQVDSMDPLRLVYEQKK